MIKKKFGIGMLILAMLLVSIAFMPAASAETLSKDDADIAVEEPITTLDTAPKSPYWYLLEADDEEQKILFSYIDNCYVSDKEKKEMKKAMKDIWKRYPDQITEQDNLTLDKVAKATAEYLNDEYGTSDVGIKWYGNTHKNIMLISCTKMGVSSTYANYASSYADDPDTWANSQIWQSYSHYYDPVIQVGDAAENCDDFAVYAKTNFNNGAYYTAYENLGYASHYMCDLGNPMHTGYATLQASHQSVHSSYESYVLNNWTTGHKFQDVIQNCNTHYTVTDPEESAKNLAIATRVELDTIYNAVYYHPSTFGSDPNVIDLTKRVLEKTAKYDKGLVKYVKG